MAKQPLLPDLRVVIANTYVLAVKTHAAHWNVQGASFFRLHQAFADQYTELTTAADDLAERLRALGQPAPLGMEELLKAATIASAIPSADGAALCTALGRDHRAISANCAQAATLAHDHDDHATADLLTRRIEAHDKTAWMLEAAAQ